ncbi:hypothetical protein ACFE04_025919 [Oxalis oulophora]
MNQLLIAIFSSLFAFTIFLYYTFYIKKLINKKAPPQAGGSWPVIGHLHLLGGQEPAHKVLGKLADKHGPIFTINLGVHRALVVSSWESAKECFTRNDKVFADRPTTLAMEILGYDFSLFGFSPYGQYWRHIRKISTVELLSLRRLQMLSNVRDSVVQSSIKNLHQLCADGNSNKVCADMKKWCSDVTLDLILSLVVGKRISDDQNASLKEALTTFFELSGLFVVSDGLPFLRWFDIGGHEKAMKKTFKELDEVVQKWLDEHKLTKVISNDHNKDQDFMDVLLSVIDETEKEFEGRDADTIIKATCLNMILAGSDTTTVTLIWALSLLVNNPRTLNKAQQELDTHVGKERQVKESDMNNLIYLQAIIKETLRLYPPGPLSVPHKSTEDCTVANYHVPANTHLHVNIWKMHRDPRIWTDPEEFQPERFLTSNSNSTSTVRDLDLRGQNFELLPFGSGRRMCPGVSFALQVLQVTLGKLLHGFEITRPSDELIDMTERVGLTNLKTTPLDLLITPRLPAHLYQ